MGKKIKNGGYTEAQLIAILRTYTEKLGKVPAKKDIPEPLRSIYHSAFGKWCYALEAAGVRTPSEAALARRARHKERWKKKHQEMSYRRTVAGKAELAAKKDNDAGDQHS